MRGADHLADPARVPSAVASTGNLVRGDTQTLIDALELQSEAALDVADHLGSELLGRALVGLMGEDHRCLMCARADIGHGLTDGSTIGIFGITIPSDDGVTTRVEVGGLLLVDATIGRAEKGGFDAKDLPQGGLNTIELLSKLCIGDCGDVGVEPSMGADRMTLFKCVTEIIDAVLVVDAIPVVAVHEESGLGPIVVVEVNDLAVPDVGTIIVGDGNTTMASGLDAGELRGSRWRRRTSIGGSAGVSGSASRAARDGRGGRRPVEPIVEIVVRSGRASIDPRDDRRPVAGDNIDGRRPSGVDGSVIKVNVVLLSRWVGEE